MRRVRCGSSVYAQKKWSCSLSTLRTSWVSPLTTKLRALGCFFGTVAVEAEDRIVCTQVSQLSEESGMSCVWRIAWGHLSLTIEAEQRADAASGWLRLTPRARVRALNLSTSSNFRVDHQDIFTLPSIASGLNSVHFEISLRGIVIAN